MTSANLVRGATVVPMLKDKGQRVEIMDVGVFQRALERGGPLIFGGSPT